MELTPIQAILLGSATALSGFALKEAAVYFFSPNKKVSRSEYEKSMREIEEKMASHKTINDERSAACEKRCKEYTDKAIENSDEKRALELKRIEDIIVLNGKQNRTILEGIKDSVIDIKKRLGRIEDTHLNKPS